MSEHGDHLRNTLGSHESVDWTRNLIKPDHARSADPAEVARASEGVVATPDLEPGHSLRALVRRQSADRKPSNQPTPKRAISRRPPLKGYRATLFEEGIGSPYNGHQGGHMRISTVREFRDQATGLLRSKTPILVTRHGRLAGIFFPRPEITIPIELKRELYEMLSNDVARQLKRRKVSEADVLADFEASRKKRRAARRGR